jgi:hypothetical protein
MQIKLKSENVRNSYDGSKVSPNQRHHMNEYYYFTVGFKQELEQAKACRALNDSVTRLRSGLPHLRLDFAV